MIHIKWPILHSVIALNSWNRLGEGICQHYIHCYSLHFYITFVWLPLCKCNVTIIDKIMQNEFIGFQYNSLTNFIGQIVSVVTFERAIYSAFILDATTVAFLLLLHVIAQFPSKNANPVAIGQSAKLALQ